MIYYILICNRFLNDVTVAVAGKVVWDRLTQDGAGGTVDMYRIVLRDDNNQVPSMVRLAM